MLHKYRALAEVFKAPDFLIVLFGVVNTNLLVRNFQQKSAKTIDELWLDF
jgi:hypothetical protein